MTGHSRERKELVGSTEDKRNWRGIVIAVLVIITVLGLIVTAIVLVTPKEVNENFGERLLYKDFIHHAFDPKPFSPVWRSNRVLMFRGEEGEVIHYDCDTNMTTTVMDNSTFRELNTESYEMSPDGKFVLLPYDINYIYRHSYIAKYKLYNTETRIHSDLSGPAVEGEEGDTPLQYVSWSPKGHALTVVIANDLYLIEDVPGRTYRRLTTDGMTDVVFNGIPDWLYEEEILLTRHAVWWSADGGHLVYGHFDDRGVSRYDMTMYGPLRNKYVENRRMPYPKPGTANPVATLRVYNVAKNETKELKPPLSFRNVSHYFTTVTWKDTSHVIITWLNRAQNVSIITICDVTNTLCYENFKTEAKTGWLEMSEAPFIAGDAYFLILSQRDGDNGSFKHIAHVDANHQGGSGVSYFVTEGPLDVVRIVGYNEDLKTIYFLAVRQEDPRERHLYSATTSKTDQSFRVVRCLTCDVNDECLYVDATFNNNSSYYVLTCKGPGVPNHQLMSTPDIYVKMLFDNPGLKAALVGKRVPTTKFLQLKTDGDEEVWVKVLYPPQLKQDEIIRYNLLVKVYGSPGTQLATHEYEITWEHFQCSANDLIIAFVDGRGSGGRGDKWLHAVHRHLGRLETEDVIAVGKYFKNLKYVGDQIGIWGVSHGGFLTSAVLGSPGNVFSCGVAVAPVTDWRYYDTFYSEKYMGLPTEEDNLEGYNSANISRYASNFRRSRFLIAHGTGDDNVHFQHSAQLMKALTDKDVYFKTLIYTDQQHWLSGGNTRNHLYNSMEDFLFTCYGKTAPRHQIPVVFEEDEDE
ncbi:prolyl endopeptidase FAP-like isoform X4 [Mya arenaria]|uniref:prolyl endopeptidase FAP-like isoform X4 n=1 Tax=Mya arenaria TaxID=6604 RepID=UPI0022E24FD5|nr:prolyl endopeptidase FAP-like isoform X4 [Mya arenaria]